MLTLAFMIEYGSQGLISAKVLEGLVLKVTTAPPEQSVDSTNFIPCCLKFHENII